VLEAGRPRLALIAAGLPLSAMTAVYTAYLFAQARGRDLWQDPLLPPHFLAQAALAGAAALSLPAAALAPASLSVLLWITAAGSLAHLMFVASQAMFPHPTAHARLATLAMTVGRYASFFWAGAALVAIGLLAPWLGPPAAILALLGLLAYEHAHVQAAQSVPLA
jgi:Ni/Fe-hydrogenase subunit HybB-like protein